MIRLDISEANTIAQMHAVANVIGRGQVRAMNQAANNIASRTYKLSPIASPHKIQAELMRPVRVAREGRVYQVPLAIVLTFRPGNSRGENAARARRLVIARKRSSGHTRSGWAHAVADLNKVAIHRNPVPSGALRHPPTGYGIPARSEREPAVIRNTVRLRGPAAGKEEGRRVAAFQRATAEETGRWNRLAHQELVRSAAKLHAQ